ncbi:hypothetical protein STRTUCAR8_09948, partial [Streptomyces turgidiscabies Car8]
MAWPGQRLSVRKLAGRRTPPVR